MQADVILLTDEQSSAMDGRAKKLLDFFNVHCQTQRAKDFAPPECSSSQGDQSYKILCAAQHFYPVIKQLAAKSNSESAAQIHSVFLYSNGDRVALAKIVSQLCGKEVSVYTGANNDLRWTITDDPEGMFGAMRGLHAYPAAETLNRSDFFAAHQPGLNSLIMSENNVAFVEVTWRNIRVFVSSVPLLDIEAELTSRNFDVRDHFFSAVPIVAYIRWALNPWAAPDASACLIIDDPLLKPRYGFVVFETLLALMRQLRFSTTIAFIPWNWRRSNPKVVQLFKDNPDCYSLCIHGCEHRGREFSASGRRIRATASEAINQMSLHQRRTGLAHDVIMIFPHGIFSPDAIAELKRAGFLAVVNTEVHCNPPCPHTKLKISDVWDVAVMAYSDFPLYTRRKPAEGVENLAFDLLLGKPCLVAIHHDFCSHGYDALSRLINQLNALQIQLVWRCLGDVLRRSFRQKEVSADSVEIEMYASELLIENRSDRAKTYWIRRRERHPESIESLRAGSKQLSWQAVGNYIAFKLELDAAEDTLVTMHFKGTEDYACMHHNFLHRTKTTLRRHLSEVRDNYLIPARMRTIALFWFMTSGVRSLKRNLFV